MAMTRQERSLIHKKLESRAIEDNEPLLKELSEGVPVFRVTDEGLVQYIKHKNTVYKSVFVEEDVTIKTLVWYDMVLENSWVRFSTSYQIPSYAKDSDGFVHLRGLIKSGTSATADITSLPSLFRPNESELHASIANNAICTIAIASDGDVWASNGGSTAWTSLEGIIFYAGS